MYPRQSYMRVLKKQVLALYLDLDDVASGWRVVLDGNEKLVGREDVLAEDELGNVVVLVHDGDVDLKVGKMWVS